MYRSLWLSGVQYFFLRSFYQYSLLLDRHMSSFWWLYIAVKNFFFNNRFDCVSMSRLKIGNIYGLEDFLFIWLIFWFYCLVWFNWFFESYNDATNFYWKYLIYHFRLDRVKYFIIILGGGQNLERQNVERSVFRSFEISNIKIMKVELFDFSILEFVFYFYDRLNYSNTQNIFMII